ncbi:MAG TPA: APC family permease [Candidatus Tectomicrobia bacterium]
MRISLRRILVGSPLPSEAYVHQRLNKRKALAVFSSDALSSVAYATEEILLVLVTAGVAALTLSLPIALVITVLLAIVATSYYQTVHGYPSGGGAYIVAHENLGVWPGLTAGAALLIDYVLTVAVSITAGVVAVTSAVPELLPFRIELCLLAIALITWGNLRGVRESGTLFSIPTYVFIGLFLTLLAVGFVRLWTGSLGSIVQPTQLAHTAGTAPLTVFLLLRAFASGCTAMTGTEAISNGVSAFEKPEADNAGKTLIAMAVLLGIMFLGITFLARTMHVVPVEHESVVSQIGRAVFGSGPLYLALQAATALILVLAANTAFADFPRLASILARDGYAPRQLANLGDRLVFSNGIGALALLAAVLVVLFRGRTHSLIPLYAVGVFLSFTLSQAGMVRHWQKTREGSWRTKAAINGLGAAATGVVLCVVTQSKFTHGAWIIFVLVPLLVMMFRATKQHYLAMREQIMLGAESIQQGAAPPYKVVVPLSSLNQASLAALRFARAISQDVTAVIVDVEPHSTANVQQNWCSWYAEIPLVVLKSPYRNVITPLLNYLQEVDHREPERGLAVVILPEIVPARWWQHLLHNQTTFQLKAVLLFREEQGDEVRIVINVPYHLRG